MEEGDYVMTMQQDQPNYWQEFRAIIKERLCKPCQHPTFVMYFLGIIIIIGSLGLLEPIVSYLIIGSLPVEHVPRALVSAAYTYFVAITATAAVDFILSHNKKYLVMFFVLCSLVVFACFLSSVIFATILHRPYSAIMPTCIGYIVALFLWWIGNAENAHLLETPVKPTAPIGDDITQPSGNLNGYNA